MRLTFDVVQNSKKFARSGRRRKRKRRMLASKKTRGIAKRRNARVKILLNPKVSLPTMVSRI
jgi:hypothetical protein